jgi:hypothetical protein
MITTEDHTNRVEPRSSVIVKAAQAVAGSAR